MYRIVVRLSSLECDTSDIQIFKSNGRKVVFLKPRSKHVDTGATCPCGCFISDDATYCSLACKVRYPMRSMTPEVVEKPVHTPMHRRKSVPSRCPSE